MQIPVRIRAYAEVVVDRATGIAHRPASLRRVVGYRDRWDAAAQQMGRVELYGYTTYPRCMTAPEPGVPELKVFLYSAGWAAMLGIDGCPACWPAEKE
jgi:hypothetical protein